MSSEPEINGTMCPSCGASITATDAFCEACGATLGQSGESPPPPVAPPAPTRGNAVGRVCRACGGQILDDGFCGSCGQKAPTERDHWDEQPAPWVAGVCDRGIVHARNEDAMALAATADRAFAVLVVCDGVTSAPDSDRASLAASRRACADLVGASRPEGGEAVRVAHWAAAVQHSAVVANEVAVGVAHALGDPPEPPSSTFVVGVLADDLLTVGWCGDSRAYWLPDAGEGVQLTTDHSLGTEMIRAGRSRAEAEADPTCHTITRWLGADSVSPDAEVVSRRLDTPGWVLVCSDGMWNDFSEPQALRGLIDAVGAGDPLVIADAMVRAANDRGGHDNITAALARFEPSLR